MSDTDPHPILDPVAAGLVLPPVLDLDETRRALRLRTRRAVHELRRRDGLPLAPVGRQWLITRQAFQEWLEERARPGLRLLADAEASR